MGRPRKNPEEASPEIESSQKPETPTKASKVPYGPDSESVGLEIKCKAEKLETEIHKTYLKLSDGRGHVVIKNDACGCSKRFKSFKSFPRHNTACPCKRYNHLILKVSVVD